ncbi:MAG: TIM barrel protein [Isosphaeraceae bacterium]|nr:TIM barrel protein [Isosphaeraceae bacterium]
MIRSPLGIALDPERETREQIRQAATLGAKGVVVAAIGDLAPDRLGETGRRDFRRLLQSSELALIAVVLPTRRGFDSLDGLELRLERAEAAFALAFSLGTATVLARVGAIPAAEDLARRPAFDTALGELGRRADRQGVRLAIETGTEPGKTVAEFLRAASSPALAASIDPARMLQGGFDPIDALRDLATDVAHVRASEPKRLERGSASPFALRSSGGGRGAIDWEEFVAVLEEIGYRGFLTVTPETAEDPEQAFRRMRDRFASL